MRIYNLFLSLLFAIGFTSCITDGESYSDLWSISVGDRLPDFTVTTSGGETFSTADLANGTAVIIFFNTECEDCRQELPELQKVYDQTRDKTVWIAISREENELSIEKFWQAKGLTIPYSAQTDRKIYQQFANSGIPRLFIASQKAIKAAFDPDKIPATDQLTAIINQTDR